MKRDYHHKKYRYYLKLCGIVEESTSSYADSSSSIKYGKYGYCTQDSYMPYTHHGHHGHHCCNPCSSMGGYSSN
ncbi:MAG TPA: hypothetical protein VJ824_17900, partial [Bacillota bacterium]|nr:hypothetical protein [Bacillota bacterium]